jgi:3-(3-hydroxy-phenyl)propionate hydroxylase
VTDYDVVIAGYGPTGAVLAALLGQEGVRTLVVDPLPDLYPLPRAVHFDDEVMQIFQRLGLAEAVLDCATPSKGYEFRAADGQILLRFSEGAVDTASGWKSGYLFHQPSLERAIRAKVAVATSVTVGLETRVAAVRDDGDTVMITLETASGEETVSARYLVGADGASSPVREMVGIGHHDLGFDEPWVVVDALVSDPSRLPAINLQLCDPARPTTCISIGKGRHRWEFMLLPGEQPDAVDDAFLAGLLDPWDVDGAISIERYAVYRFHALIAQQWRKGRVMLAGDAAHQMPPFAGQGMCSGLRDAANLAWKLGAIIRGDASDAILDSYQPEREGNVRAYIGLAIGMGQMVCLLDPDAVAQRDAAMIAQRAAGGEALKPPELPPITGIVCGDTAKAGTRFFQPWADGQGLEDVMGPGAWLIGREVEPSASAGVTGVALRDPRIAPFRDALDGWLSKAEADAVLVRPDRYVFGTGASASLRDAWHTGLRA